ncbi:protein shisa-5 isoform X3 [Musca domestica]|uniref:Protein shisa-5 isoform X3 n=1 Tax=Musca domestica TaxID=7370 RepID=A0ABM3V7Q7_MUSDO|nr:protein shisa-5 isoform X3 [Musca domestica]
MFTFNRVPISNSNDQSDQFTLNDHHHTSTIIMCVIFAVVLFVFTTVMCCAYAKKRKRNPHAIFPETPIVVTSATHTAPGGYPVSQMPVGATTATTATAYQTQSYATPYPPQGAPTQMPMPMPACPPGVQPPHVAPYPPMPSAAPPSYDVAVSGAGAGVPNNGSYEKQAPYNPNFSG